MSKTAYEPSRMSDTRKIAKMSQAHIVINIRNVAEQATQAERDGGKMAYRDYHRIMSDVAKRYGVEVYIVTGVFCALSPNSDWMGNLRSMITMVKGFTDGWPIEDITVTTYHANRERAWRLMQGESFTDVFKGLKVINFFQSIVNPRHPEAVTVDGHIANVVRNQKNGMWYSGLNNTEYKRVKTAVQKVALDMRLLPSQLQAILWFTWKRIHNVIPADASEMFDREFNSLRPYINTARFQPFPRKENAEPFDTGARQQMSLFDE